MGFGRRLPVLVLKKPHLLEEHALQNSSEDNQRCTRIQLGWFRVKRVVEEEDLRLIISKMVKDATGGSFVLPILPGKITLLDSKAPLRESSYISFETAPPLVQSRDI